jgi:hypothetical protein
MSSPALLHLLARRAKRKCGAAGSEPVNASGSEAAAGADRPRFGRHVLPCVVDVCISESAP